MEKFLLVVFISIFFSPGLFSQVTPPISAPADTLRLVQIKHADRYSYKKIDSTTELQILVGHVLLQHENTTFSSDSTVINRNSGIVEAFGNIHINDEDSIHAYSQYLLYYMDTKIAILKKKVTLTDGRSKLFTEELEYDVDQKLGIYRNGGRVVNESSVLTSKEGTYYADIKDVYFKYNVVLKDPEYELKSDSLLYNTNSEIATFIAKTYIKDSSGRTIQTSEGFYDLKNKYSFLGSRPVVRDGSIYITANDIATDDKTGIDKLTGNAVFIDTAQGIMVLANKIETNRKDGEFMATQKPLMILKQENDSIYITADTLFAGRLSKRFGNVDTIAGREIVKAAGIVDKKNDSADRYFQGYHHVRIFSDSLQAVSDSLFYSAKDSIFRLFKDPIIWSGDSQVTGDTVYLYTKNKKAERLFVFENGMIINKTGNGMFNQVRGNRLNGYFKEGEFDYMRVQGNAESIYYVKDKDSLLIGINKASADIIDMRFVNKEINRIVFINEPQATIYPINKIADEERILRNFQWLEKKRPKTKFELFGN